MARKKKQQDTSPLAMGRKQKGSSAYKREQQQTGSAPKSQSSSVTNQERIDQKSWGSTSGQPQKNTYTRSTTSSGSQRQKAQQKAQQQAVSKGRSIVNRTNNTQSTSTAQRPRTTAATAREMQQRRAQEQAVSRGTNPTSTSAEERKNRPATAAELRAQRSRTNAAVAQAQKDITDRANSSVQTAATARELQQKRAQAEAVHKSSLSTKDSDSYLRDVASNTGAAANKAIKDVASGYGQTLDDLTEMTATNKNGIQAKAMKMGIDTKDKQKMSELERERQLTAEKAREHRLTLAEKQEKRQKEFDERTKDATGLEKAWYGAVESGTGMLTDIAIGSALGGQAGSLGSMAIRTYGNTRGQAEKEGATENEEGATENEDRTYAALQALKEVGTELISPGVGLAKGYAGKKGLPLADRIANKLTKNLSGKAANLAGSGLRLAGGIGEENAEEAIGWGLDPLIKEVAYGRNVRQRNIQSQLKNESDDLRKNIQSEEDAQYAAAYLGSDEFMQQNIQQCMDAGMTEEKATAVAEQMRDYMTASLSGDTEAMEQIQNSLADTLSDRSIGDYLHDLDKSELKDTIASTTLLTLTTGLPGTVSTARKAAVVRDQLGEQGVQQLATMAEDFEDMIASARGKAAKENLESGKDLTDVQLMDLLQAQSEQVQKDDKRYKAKEQTARVQNEDERNVEPMLVRNADGTIQGDEVIRTQFVESANESADIIRDITKGDENRSLTDTEIRDGAQAIAAFETGDFTVKDANELNWNNTEVRTAFEKKTGVDLKQYIVRDKRGEVDIPATNAATKDALFAMAADNLVQTSRAETANWMDKVKGETVTQITQRMGGQGTLALQASLDNLDERDRSTYMRTALAADSLYQAGRNMDTSWENVKNDATRAFKGVDEKILQEMFTAGQMDRMVANSKVIGKSVKMGEAMSTLGEQNNVVGQVVVETAEPPKGTMIRTFTEIANSLGVEIHLVDALTDKEGNAVKGANGTYKDGKIYLNVTTNVEQNVGYIFMHEVTHHIKQFAPEQYQELENLVRDKWFRFDGDQMQAEIAKTIDLYKKVANQTLSEEEALEEIIADAAHEFLNDPDFAKEVADTNPTLAKSILNSIRNALRMLRQIMGKGTIEDETHMNSLFSQLGILDEAERIWLRAYTVAAQNKAAIGIDNLQEKIYEEGRQSISGPRSAAARYEQDYKLTQKQFRSFYSAHKLNLRGQDNIDEQIADIKENGFRSTTALSNVMPVSTNDTISPGNMNIMQNRYGVRKGETVLLVPNSFVDRHDRVKDGFVPRNYEVVTAERDFQPYYELYEKAYDEAQNKQDTSTTANSDTTDSEGNPITEEEARVLRDVGPDVRFSFSTENEPQAKATFRAGKGEFRGFKMEASGRDLREELIRQNFPEKQASKIVKSINSFMDAAGAFLTDKNGLRMKYQFIGWDDLESGTVSIRRDKNGKIRSVNFSAMKRNDEYPVNFDFSTVCNKRISFTKVIEEIAQARDAETGASVFSEIKLTPDNMWKINEALKAEGIDTACLGCFVESRRYHIDTFFQNVEDRWNKPVREARRKLGLEEEEYFNFSKEEVSGEEWSAADDNWGDYGRSKAFKGAPLARTQALMDEIVKSGDVDSPLLKLIKPSDLLTPEGFEGFRKLSNAKIDMIGQIKSMYGAGVPKEILGFTPYNSEIALLPKTYKGTPMQKYLKSIGGIRIQSFSDFMIEHVYDHFQLIADAAYRKLPIHAYTKVIAYAKIFGLTGAKINMSVMFDVKNSKQWATDLGISEEDATKYADKYQGLRFVESVPDDYQKAYDTASTDEKLKKKYDKYIADGATEDEARRKTADWAVRPYRPITLEGKEGYLTYLVSDADYVNEEYQKMYDQYISEGMSPEEAERKANSNKPFEQSINYREAKALQDQDGYKDNVGIIGVAFGDEHLRMMMDDENIRYIIPYHSSTLPVVVANKTNLKVARDYSDYQSTYRAASWTLGGETVKDLKATYKAFKEEHKNEPHPAQAFFAYAFENNLEPEYGGKVEGSNTGAFDVYKSLDDAQNIQDVSEAFLEDCINNNYIPVFHEFADHPGYYKMLFDFMVADDDGVIHPQHEVRNNYPGVDVDAKADAGETVSDDDLSELKNVIEEGAKAQNDKLQRWEDRKGNVMQDLLSREGEHSITADSNINSIRYGTEDYTNPKTGSGVSEEGRLSITPEMDAEYMSAVNSGNMEEAQRLVDEAATRAGYNTPRLYHGTPSFGFTTFDLGRGENIIFATSNPLTAETYSGETSRTRISDAPEIDVDKLSGEELLKEAAKRWNKYNSYRLMTPEEKESALKDARLDVKMYASRASDFIDENKDAFNDEKLAIANRAVDALERLSTAWRDDEVDNAWNDFEDAIWDLKWADESIQFELSRAIQSGGSLLFAKNRISDFMYAGNIYKDTVFENTDYIFDRQFALELEADLHKGIYGLYGKGDNQLVIDANGSNWNQITPPDELNLYGPQKTRSIAEAANAKGYDSVLFKNLKDNGGGTAYNGISDVYMFFNPSQVKSADPVTYAEDGSVIPLSERFNPENDDIRYSMSTIDSDGNILSDGQMEYFKNSQARDEQGRLVTLYHGTFRAPRITVFSGSSDGYWFTSSRDIAEDYSMGDEMGEIGALVGKERNPYDTDDEYFEKQGFTFAEDDSGEWTATRTDERTGREFTYPWTAESKEELMNRIYEAAESEESFDSQFSLRDIYPCYLNITNPKVIECNGSIHDDVNGTGMSTRDLAAEAVDEGYDGIIFRNVADPFENIDVYVAFSSNQIKDIRNENPTENPDIRYSITPDEETMNQLAYDDAMDDSYDAFLDYETAVVYGTESEFFKGRGYAAGFSEEDISAFYNALKAEDAVPSADPKFEEDRVRRAKSKEEFFTNVNAKWNDRWTTEGEVLDIDSVKKNVTELVKATMANSDTTAKYRSELVRQTLIDMRTAYQFMKQDRTDAASYLLYHSAQRMIEGVEFIRDDTAFKEYKEIRDFLRKYKITVPDEYFQNELFNDFRKEYYGRLRIGKGNNNIESVYSDLESRWPHLFNEDERTKAGLGDAVEDLLEHIGVVVDSNVTPFMEAYSSEEAVAVAFDTADALYDIMVGGEELKSLADTYKERMDDKIKALKVRHHEAILRERKIRDEGIQKERAKWRAREDQRKERQAHRTYFDRIKETHDKLVERLTTNTADSHIPQQYKKELAGLLAAFDLQTEGSKAREARTGHVAQKTIKMNAIRSALRVIEAKSDTFHINDSITYIIENLSGIEGQTIDSLSAAQLKDVDNMLRSLLHEFNNYEKIKVNMKKVQAAEIARAVTTSALEHAKIFGPGNDYFGPKGWADQIINMDEMTPAYMFKRIDPEGTGLGIMWKEIRRSQDKYIRNTAKIQGWIDEITGKYHNKGKFRNKYGADELEKWRSTNYTQTFNLTNGTIKLTPAQMMSLYCLSKRNQAKGHMLGAGVVVAPVRFQASLMSDLKRKINRSLPVILNEADIETVVAQLTPDQISVAEQLQELMSTKMAEMGNEASMNVIGIELFTEQDYFPIKSDKAALERDINGDQFENAIRNFGFAKAVQPGARNAIMIEDIFDVVAEHCNNMNLYNSYSETLNDFMKVFNKHTIMENGADYSVRQAISHAYSNKATNFIMEFIRDLNGNVSRGRQTGIENAMNDMLSNAKKASVFANIRVFLQQPTAITRAFAVIDPKYLKGISLVDVTKGMVPTVTTDVMNEMFEHCPIALWKSWGYYDINMGRSIENVIMNEGNWLEDLATEAYGKADNVTWAAIWQMVKEETKDKHQNVEEGSDEFWEICNDRMSEIVDLTQVVDSPLHRSHAMRSKDVLHKTLTSFMAEPTLTFNMIRDGIVTAREAWVQGDKSKASRIIGRTTSVMLFQAVTVSAAAAIADALRGKNKSDDDDDEGFGTLWLTNFFENFKDEMKIWNKVYYIKDLASIAEGWDNANLALQGWKTTTDGFRDMWKKLSEGSTKSWWDIYYNLLGGVGYFTGAPVRTLMRDGKAILDMFGIELPESLVGKEKSEPVISETSPLQKLGKDKKDSKSSSLLNVDTEDKWYDYENNPITVKDGSTADKILNHFGINLTAAEKAAIAKEQKQKARDSKAEEISDKYADLSDEERDQKVWSAVTSYIKTEDDGKAFADLVAEGEYSDINKIKQMYIAAGGGAEYFDERVFNESKKALKKSIAYDTTDQQFNAQQNMLDYLKSHGMTAEEISSEIVYKSDIAKDMKVAFRLGDKQLMQEALQPLAEAGIQIDDLNRLWENRNRMDLTKYKGRFKDKLKSTGTFIWPTQGIITSKFGYRSAASTGGIGSTNHPAIDIGASMGADVVAADGGVVIYTGSNGGYGNSVGIKHDNGMVTYYNHLSAWNVKKGDTVAQGQLIAAVGSTGNSTGPHLDFKVLDQNGEPVDPMQFLDQSNVKYALDA